MPISRWWPRRPRKPALSREQALGCRPVKNPKVCEVERRETGLVLSYPVRPRQWVATFLGRMKWTGGRVVTRRLELDALGTAVWRMIDGRRSVADIIRSFADRYGVLEQEAEIAVTRFLRALGRRGLIGLME